MCSIRCVRNSLQIQPLCDGIFSILPETVMSKKLLCPERSYSGIVLNALYKLCEYYAGKGTKSKISLICNLLYFDEFAKVRALCIFGCALSDRIAQRPRCAGRGRAGRGKADPYRISTTLLIRYTSLMYHIVKIKIG